MNDNTAEITARVEEITGRPVYGRIKIVSDTTDWMNITWGDVLYIGGRYYLLKGNMMEPRFGIDDQPKLWVFRAIDLETEKVKIIKTVFNEEFIAHIGFLKIRCYRSPEKEGKVLDVVRGNPFFMQGHPFIDSEGNNVRIIDFIHGKTLFHKIPSIEKDHKTYFHEDLPLIMQNLLLCLKSIAILHENDLCHGDIRNDHIIIDSETGTYRWIDFDLKQDVSDFDIWSFGNIINYAVSKGIVTFKSILKDKSFSERVRKSLSMEHASAFYEYRIMDVGHIFPYVSKRLRNLLQHFTISPKSYFTKIDDLIDAFSEVVDVDFSGQKANIRGVGVQSTEEKS
ncbi:MAG: protein kinase [Calditrichaeota bacterium]|jgi:hypothetical protein|nr:protein kinase [Calditrichota bacterium]MBT7617059.1 protein kinase [Calditrichota bacterium]MBT7788196.1 protein kinase [Calditrichota bacterium]